MSEGHPNEGIVSRFARRTAAKHGKKEAQLDVGDEGIDKLFKPEPMSKDPDDLGDELGDELGGDLSDELEEESTLDRIKKDIETGDLTVDDLDELGDFVAEKRVEMTEDDIDTEMDRDEAEAKDDMKKDDEPLGGEGNASMGYGSPSAGGGGSAPKATGTPVM